MSVYVYISICMGAYVFISICMGVHIYMYSVQDGEATSEMRARFTGEMVVLRGIFLATYERALADKNVDKPAGIRQKPAGAPAAASEAEPAAPAASVAKKPAGEPKPAAAAAADAAQAAAEAAAAPAAEAAAAEAEAAPSAAADADEDEDEDDDGGEEAGEEEPAEVDEVVEPEVEEKHEKTSTIVETDGYKIRVYWTSQGDRTPLILIDDMMKEMKFGKKRLGQVSCKNLERRQALKFWTLIAAGYLAGNINLNNCQESINKRKTAPTHNQRTPTTPQVT